MASAAVHLRISGRVHGVGYRAWLAREAERRALSGWVRNRPDGSVEAVLTGESGVVAEVAALCRQGPRAAIVSDVISEDYDGPLRSGFRILPTG